MWEAGRAVFAARPARIFAPSNARPDAEDWNESLQLVWNDPVGIQR